MSDSNKNMLINVEDDETRIAIANNQMLDNLYIDYTHRAQTVGNIYIGIVVKIQSSFVGGLPSINCFIQARKSWFRWQRMKSLTRVRL